MFGTFQWDEVILNQRLSIVDEYLKFNVAPKNAEKINKTVKKTVSRDAFFKECYIKRVSPVITRRNKFKSV